MPCEEFAEFLEKEKVLPEERSLIERAMGRVRSHEWEPRVWPENGSNGTLESHIIPMGASLWQISRVCPDPMPEKFFAWGSPGRSQPRKGLEYSLTPSDRAVYTATGILHDFIEDCPGCIYPGLIQEFENLQETELDIALIEAITTDDKKVVARNFAKLWFNPEQPDSTEPKFDLLPGISDNDSKYLNRLRYCTGQLDLPNLNLDGQKTNQQLWTILETTGIGAEILATTGRWLTRKQKLNCIGLAREFGPRIARAVLCLTREKINGNVTRNQILNHYAFQLAIGDKYDPLIGEAKQIDQALNILYDEYFLRPTEEYYTNMAKQIKLKLLIKLVEKSLIRKIKFEEPQLLHRTKH